MLAFMVSSGWAGGRRRYATAADALRFGPPVIGLLPKVFRCALIADCAALYGTREPSATSCMAALLDRDHPLLLLLCATPYIPSHQIRAAPTLPQVLRAAVPLAPGGEELAGQLQAVVRLWTELQAQWDNPLCAVAQLPARKVARPGAVAGAQQVSTARARLGWARVALCVLTLKPQQWRVRRPGPGRGARARRQGALVWGACCTRGALCHSGSKARGGQESVSRFPTCLSCPAVMAICVGCATAALGPETRRWRLFGAASRSW